MERLTAAAAATTTNEQPLIQLPSSRLIDIITDTLPDYPVEIRANNDKVDGGGQTRTIYSQRHLSPHRMMHFGKRPMTIQPPTILTPQVLDLYNKGRSLAAQEAASGLQSVPAPSQLRPDYYPYLFSIELENGQTLSAVPEGK